MRLISHRGNISGPSPLVENTHGFIQAAIDDGYDVEIDVRLINGSLYLGHDNPEHPVELTWLMDRKHNLWIHTKNFGALDFLLGKGLKVFYHQLEKHTVIGNTNVIWSHDLSEASERSIIPLISLDDVLLNKNLSMRFYGVCSDHIGRFRQC